MKHDFLDKYSDLESPVHRLDARVKVGVALGFLLALNLVRVPAWWIFAAAAALLIAGVVAARIPFLYVFARALAAVPFAAIAGVCLPFMPRGDAAWALPLTGTAVYAEGVRLYAALLLKTYLSLAAATLVVATTPFPRLLRAFAWFRVPVFFLNLLAFTYRYVFVLIDDAERLARGWRTRYYGRRPFARLISVGPAAASLFVRSYERAERVWGAMLSRGYRPEKL